MIDVSSDVKVYEFNNMSTGPDHDGLVPELMVESHCVNSNLIELYLPTRTTGLANDIVLAVNADDLRAAIDNALHTGRR